MFVFPKVVPLYELDSCESILSDIYEYESNNWAIGQSYPAGGPDGFTYFFSVRNIPIANYLRGTISIGEPTAYDENIRNLKKYINWVVEDELLKCLQKIKEIREYQEKLWAIGEAYPDAGPDQFVVFFGERNLIIEPFLRGTVDIGEPTAYCNNIATLIYYMDKVRSHYKYC